MSFYHLSRANLTNASETMEANRHICWREIVSQTRKNCHLEILYIFHENFVRVLRTVWFFRRVQVCTLTAVTKSRTRINSLSTYEYMCCELVFPAGITYGQKYWLSGSSVLEVSVHCDTGHCVCYVSSWDLTNSTVNTAYFNLPATVVKCH